MTADPTAAAIGDTRRLEAVAAGVEEMVARGQEAWWAAQERRKG